MCFNSPLQLSVLKPVIICMEMFSRQQGQAVIYPGGVVSTSPGALTAVVTRSLRKEFYPVLFNNLFIPPPTPGGETCLIQGEKYWGELSCGQTTAGKVIFQFSAELSCISAAAPSWPGSSAPLKSGEPQCWEQPQEWSCCGDKSPQHTVTQRGWKWRAPGF